MTDVAIVGGTEETRLLLRGLSRLHHHRVIFEGPTPASLAELPTEPTDLVILVDGDIESEEWSTPLEGALRAHPTRRAVLISPSRSPRVELRAKDLGVSAILRRPFAVHELVTALAPPSEAASPPSSDPDPGSDARPP